ncbi:MAG: PPC domain-containing DNA-binding protein [Patescibacteria group bacterium]
MQTYSFRIEPDQDLREEIQRVVDQHAIDAGVILSGVGSLRRARIRLADAGRFLEAEQDYEIVSLTGTISRNGSHLHLSVSDDQGKTVGGHLSKGCVVRTTAEIVIGVVQGTYRRKPDSRTGYDELVVEE